MPCDAQEPRPLPWQWLCSSALACSNAATTRCASSRGSAKVTASSFRPGEHSDLPAEFFRSLHNKRARHKPLGRHGQRAERRAVGELTDAHQVRLIRHGATVAGLANHSPIAPDRRDDG